MERDAVWEAIISMLGTVRHVRFSHMKGGGIEVVVRSGSGTITRQVHAMHKDDPTKVAANLRADYEDMRVKAERRRTERTRVRTSGP